MEDPSEGARGWLQIAVTVITLVTVTALSVAFANRRKNSSRLPPGPRGWPMFGSLLSIGSFPHQSFSRMSKQYGPLMFMRMGSVPTLVVSSPHMAKEILKTHDQFTASRPDHLIPSYLTYSQRDVAFAPHGPHWRHARKICTLELFTVQRISQFFQGVILRENMVMLQSMFKKSENALNMKEIFSTLASNIITQMMWSKSHFGDSLSADATAFQHIFKEYSFLFGTVNIGDYIPALTPLSMKLLGLDKRMKDCFEKMDKFLDTVIDEHRKTAPSVAKERNDFVDVLLKPSDQAGSEGEPLPVDIVKAIVFDMVAGGTETTSSTMEWALTEVVRHPSVMKRMQDELDLVVGRDRLVTEEDIPELKYLQAVIKEVFRRHQPAPLNIPHKSTQDCEIEGYQIPAGTQIFINAWSIQRDPAVWERPLEFDPDRFFNSPVDVKGQHYELLPFGSGRRMCPASNLALAEVQFTTALIVQAFTLTLPGGQKPEEMDISEASLLTLPKAIPLTLVAKPRLPTHLIHPTSP